MGDEAHGERKPYTVNALNSKLAAARSVVNQFEKKGHLPTGMHDLFRKQVDNSRLKANKERGKPNARVRTLPLVVERKRYAWRDSNPRHSVPKTDALFR